MAILHMDGRKSLRMIFLRARRLSHKMRNAAQVRLTKALPRGCIGPERTLVMLQKCKEGKPHKEDSGSSIILEPYEAQVSRHARNSSIAWELE